MVLYPTLIQPLFNKLTPLPEGELKDRVYALAKQLNFPLKKIYVIDGSKRSAHSNAVSQGECFGVAHIGVCGTSPN
jgi:STE24 endopeptidase